MCWGIPWNLGLAFLVRFWIRIWKCFMSAINKDQKLGVVPNLFRFEWNQISSKLKSLVFHSA